MILGNLNNPLPPIDMSFVQKLNREILELRETMNQVNLNEHLFSAQSFLQNPATYLDRKKMSTNIGNLTKKTTLE